MDINDWDELIDGLARVENELEAVQPIIDYIEGYIPAKDARALRHLKWDVEGGIRCLRNFVEEASERWEDRQ